MKYLNMIFLLVRIVFEWDDELLQLIVVMFDGKKIFGNLMVICFKFVVGDFIIFMLGCLGILVVVFVNIMIEGVMCEIFILYQVVVICIFECFWLLMDEYNLLFLEVVYLFVDWNMSLGVLENWERMFGYMILFLLEKLFEWFYVSIGWFLGKIVFLVWIIVFFDWFDVFWLLMCRIQEINLEDFIVWLDFFFI